MHQHTHTHTHTYAGMPRFMYICMSMTYFLEARNHVVYHVF